MAYRTNTDILKTPTAWVKGTVTPSSEAGKSVWTEAGGVLSIQPDGTIQHRSAGTDGPYERGVLTGGRLIYDVGVAVVFDVSG